MGGSDQLSLAYLLPDPGIPVGGTKGASVHVESLCAALVRAGVHVVLYAAKVTGPLRAPGAAGVTVVPVDVGEVRSGPGGDRTRIAATGRFFDQVARQLSAARPDWIQERLSLFAGGGTDLAAALGLERVVEVNAPIADERARHFGLELVDDAHAAERAALREARVVAVSDPLAAWARENGAAETLVVPNGADTLGLDPAIWDPLRPGIRRELGFGEQVVVGFTGSLKPWHGVEVLLDAVASLSPWHPVGLLIVGDGPGRAVTCAAMRTLPPGVTAVATGAVPAGEVARYLAAMDISVAPYTPGGTFYFSPLKVTEAMAAGRAVVASDFPPVRDLLGGTGVLVPPGNSTRLAEALESLVGDADTRRRLGLAARARAVVHLDWAQVAERTCGFARRPHHQVAAAGSTG